MIFKQSLKGALSGKLIASDKYREIQDKQAKYLNDKGELLDKVQKSLGASSEIDQLIITLFDVISGGEDLIKLIPEYFELLEEYDLKGKKEASKRFLSLFKEKEEQEYELLEVTEKLKKLRTGIVKGGQFSSWKKHENAILNVIAEYESDENRVKYKNDSSKLTQSKARQKIEQKTGLSVTESTFNSWLNRLRKKGKVFS